MDAANAAYPFRVLPPHLWCSAGLHIESRRPSRCTAGTEGQTVRRASVIRRSIGHQCHTHPCPHRPPKQLPHRLLQRLLHQFPYQFQRSPDGYVCVHTQPRQTRPAMRDPLVRSFPTAPTAAHRRALARILPRPAVSPAISGTFRSLVYSCGTEPQTAYRTAASSIYIPPCAPYTSHFYANSASSTGEAAIEIGEGEGSLAASIGWLVDWLVQQPQALTAQQPEGHSHGWLKHGMHSEWHFQSSRCAIHTTFPSSSTADTTFIEKIATKQIKTTKRGAARIKPGCYQSARVRSTEKSASGNLLVTTPVVTEASVFLH